MPYNDIKSTPLNKIILIGVFTMEQVLSQVPTEALSAFMAYFLALGMVAYIASAVIGLFYIIVEWRLFSKGGCPGIACIVPIWNLWCYAKILFGRGWAFLLYLIPGVNLIMLLISPFRMAKVYGHGFGYGLGLFFLPWLFMPILAFGQSDYCGPNF